MNAAKPPEQSKGLGGNIGCKSISQKCVIRSQIPPNCLGKTKILSVKSSRLEEHTLRIFVTRSLRRWMSLQMLRASSSSDSGTPMLAAACLLVSCEVTRFEFSGEMSIHLIGNVLLILGYIENATITIARDRNTRQ